MTLGTFAEVGGEAVGASGKINAAGGIQFGGRDKNKPDQCPTKGYASFSPQSSFGKPSGIKAVAAIGLEGCAFGASQ
jgi:hypothetical protein